MLRVGPRCLEYIYYSYLAILCVVSNEIKFWYDGCALVIEDWIEIVKLPSSYTITSVVGQWWSPLGSHVSESCLWVQIFSRRVKYLRSENGWGSQQHMICCHTFRLENGWSTPLQMCNSPSFMIIHDKEWNVTYSCDQIIGRSLEYTQSKIIMESW